MIIYAGIDGTGIADNDKYHREFENSHVRNLYKDWNYRGYALYERGPALAGFETGYLAKKIYQGIIRRMVNWSPEMRAKAVFLAGYSRGGAAVIEVAKWLKADGIPVESLILFDPVDRAIHNGVLRGMLRNTPIVDTVKNVIYAKRSPRSKSRESFGNCGLRAENLEKTNFIPPMEFKGTHGALGGVPWKLPKGGNPEDYIDEGFPDYMTDVKYREDESISTQVGNWVRSLVFDHLYECVERLGAPTYMPVIPPANPSIPRSPRIPNGNQRIHTVKPGDWLSKIAITYYGDMNRWSDIYDHPENKKTIGPNPDLIKPGQKLIIP